MWTEMRSFCLSTKHDKTKYFYPQRIFFINIRFYRLNADINI